MCPANGTKGNNYNSEQVFEIKDDINPVERWAKGPNMPNQKELDVHIKNAEQAFTHEMGGGGFGIALGLMIPIVLVLFLAFWIMYAYRNPHTKSGQLLIQVSHRRFYFSSLKFILLTNQT